MNYNQPIDNFGEVIPIADFILCVINQFFTDYDGFGYPIKDNLVDEDFIIRPSEIKGMPKDATHIIWYNK